MYLSDEMWSSGLIYSGGVGDEVILCKWVRRSPTIYSSHSVVQVPFKACFLSTLDCSAEGMHLHCVLEIRPFLFL